MALCPGLPGWAGTRKVKPIWTSLKQRDGEWQWHQLGYMQLCTSLQTDNHASTPPLSFYRLDALSAAQPTAWKHWWHKKIKSNTAKANMHLEQNIPQHKMNTAKLVNRSSIYQSRVHLHLQQVPCLTPLQQSWDQALYARLGVQQPAVQCTLTPMYSWKLQIICTVSGTYPLLM